MALFGDTVKGSQLWLNPQNTAEGNKPAAATTPLLNNGHDSSESMPANADRAIPAINHIYIHNEDGRKIKITAQENGTFAYAIEGLKTSHMPLVPRSNEYVRKSSKNIAAGSMVLEVFFGAYLAKYLILNTDPNKPGGIDGFTQAFLKQEMPKTFSYSLAITLSFLDFLNNISTFSPDKESKDFSKDLPDGYLDGLKRLGQHLKEHPVFIFVVASMFFNFLFGTWADVDPVDGFLNSYIGLAKWFVEAPMLLFGFAYYVFFCGKDVFEAVDYFKNKEAKQPYALQMMIPRKGWQFSTGWQILFEGASQHLIRGSSFAALGDMFFQGGLQTGDAGSNLIAKILGGITGAIISILTRHVRVASHYLGDKDERLDLVNDVERTLYWKSMSWSQYLSRKAWQSPMTGLSTAGHAVFFNRYAPSVVSNSFTIPLSNIGVGLPSVSGGAAIAGTLGLATQWRASTKQQLDHGFLQASQNAYLENYLVVLNKDKKPPVSAALSLFKQVAKSTQEALAKDPSPSLAEQLILLELLNKAGQTAVTAAKQISLQITLWVQLQEENVVEKILEDKADPMLMFAINFLLAKKQKASDKYLASVRMPKTKEIIQEIILTIQNQLLSDLQDLKQILGNLTPRSKLVESKEIQELLTENSELIQEVNKIAADYAYVLEGKSDNSQGNDKESKSVGADVTIIIDTVSARIGGDRQAKEQKLEIKVEEAAPAALIDLFKQQMLCHHLVNDVRSRIKKGADEDDALDHRIDRALEKAKRQLHAAVFGHQQGVKEQEKIGQINHFIQIMSKDLLDLHQHKNKLKLDLQDQIGQLANKKKNTNLVKLEKQFEEISQQIAAEKQKIKNTTGQDKKRLKVHLRKLENKKSDLKGEIALAKKYQEEFTKVAKDLALAEQEIEAAEAELTCLVEIHHALSKDESGVRRFLKPDFDLTNTVRLLAYLYDPKYWRKPKLGDKEINLALPAGSSLTMKKHLSDLRKLEADAETIEKLNLDGAIAYLTDNQNLYMEQSEDLGMLRQERLKLVGAYLQCTKLKIIEQAPIESSMLAEIVNIGSQLARAGNGGGFYPDDPLAGYIASLVTGISNYRFMKPKVKQNLPNIVGFFSSKSAEQAKWESKKEVKETKEALRAVYC